MRNTVSTVRCNSDGRDRIALNRRKQDTAERIADRRPESRFKRIRRKLSVIRIRFERSVSNAFRLFKTLEQIFASHPNSLCRIELKYEPFFAISQIGNFDAIRPPFAAAALIAVPD